MFMPTTKANRVITGLETMRPQGWYDPVDKNGSASLPGTLHDLWMYNAQGMRIQVGMWIIMLYDNYWLL
jgi:hypothetical protein